MEKEGEREGQGGLGREGGRWRRRRKGGGGESVYSSMLEEKKPNEDFLK